MTKEITEAVLMFIKHIRPDGELYPFDLKEVEKLESIAKSIKYDAASELEKEFKEQPFVRGEAVLKAIETQMMEEVTECQ